MARLSYSILFTASSILGSFLRSQYSSQLLGRGLYSVSRVGGSGTFARENREESTRWDFPTKNGPLALHDKLELAALRLVVLEVLGPLLFASLASPLRAEG